jgi:hypothetical protein
MTEYDLAELRGELFAFKAIMASCLGFVASHYDDPGAFLAQLEKTIVAGTTEAAPLFAPAQYQASFVRAATGWAGTVIEGARQQTGPRPQLQ